MHVAHQLAAPNRVCASSGSPADNFNAILVSAHVAIHNPCMDTDFSAKSPEVLVINNVEKPSEN